MNKPSGFKNLTRKFLFMGIGFLITSQASAVPKGYKLIWNDEFKQPAGSAPDPQKWTYTLQKDNQDEVETYTNSAQNASIVQDPLGLDGSALRIQAIKDAKGTYTSARIVTKGLFTFKYGYVECRAKLPYGQGMWPAFWTLGEDIDKVSWPACGEVDIMEAIGKEPAINHGSIHGPGYTGEKLGSSYILPDGKLYKDAYHTFAMEWTPKYIRFYVDDHPYQTFTSADLPAGGKWVFDHPFYMILQLALGGGWSGNPAATTVFPQSLMVDYVRVYQLPPTVNPKETK
jgi:beta-glucanase (GH16 family)